MDSASAIMSEKRVFWRGTMIPPGAPGHRGPPDANLRGPLLLGLIAAKNASIFPILSIPSEEWEWRRQ